MAKIDELLQELCPDGVEYVSLGSICNCITGGDTPKDCIKGQEEPTAEYPYPVYSNGDAVYGYCKTYRVDKAAVTVSSIGNVGTAFYRKPFFTPIIRLKTFIPNEDSLDVKFLYFCLSGMDFIGTNSSLSSMKAADFKKIPIPLPPLPIQQYIVETLDTFTDAISNLEEELALREKQFEYYRSEFVDNNLYSEVKLKDVASYSKLKVNASEVTKDTYISVENLLQNKAGKIESSCCPTSGKCTKFLPKDILIGNIRPYLKKIWFSDCEGGTNGDVLDIRVQSDILEPKYLFEILSSDNFFRYHTQHSAGGKMPRGDKNAVMNYSFCIPPIERQQEVVEILDTFEAMIANIKEEIALRTKQYEYYREKLLSFGK